MVTTNVPSKPRRSHRVLRRILKLLRNCALRSLEGTLVTSISKDYLISILLTYYLSRDQETYLSREQTGVYRGNHLLFIQNQKAYLSYDERLQKSSAATLKEQQKGFSLNESI